MATINKKRVLHKTKKSAIAGKSADAIFTVKQYGYDFDSLKDHHPSDLYPVEGWQKGARLLSSFLLLLIFASDRNRKKTIEVIEDLMSGLPKSLAVQAIKAAEDLMRAGKAGHFVSCPAKGVLQFDTYVESQAYMYANAAAQAALEDQVNHFLLEKTKGLVFLV